MSDFIKIKKQKQFEVSKNVYNYLSPDYVYIPYEKGYKINVTDKEKVLKDSLVLTKENFYIYSPISGTVLGLTEMVVQDKKTSVIVIENDFKEQVKKIKGVKKYLSDYSKTDVKDILNLYNLNLTNDNGKILLINGIDYEVYEKNRSTIIKKYPSEILETIDALYTIFNCEKCYFALKNNDSENVENLIHHVGTYPNIDLKMMPDLYPISYPKILKRELIMPHNEGLGTIYLTVEDIYNIYNILKRNRPVTEKYITISGNMIETPKVINVKIGSSLNEIITNNYKLKAGDYQIIINGLLSGYETNSLNFVITKDINSVFLNKVNDKKAKECINCGLCHTKCPVGADPRTGYKMDQCINCGTCRYICPAYINLKERGK
ncbi:MAG: hypothetical protein PHG03_04720 [Bacilli bacterium]|nr:hypothetical protein [Bacilli bacterium]MDD4795838.1 hypothetical protein [Bacilli bacterium]